MDEQRGSPSGILFGSGQRADRAADEREQLYRHFTQLRHRADLMALISTFLRSLQFSDFSFSLHQTDNNPAYYYSTCAAISDFYRGLADWEFDISAVYATSDRRPLFQSTVEGYLARAPFITSALARSRALHTLAHQLGFEEIYHMPLRIRGEDCALLSIGARYAPRVVFCERVGRHRQALEHFGERVAAVVPQLFSGPELRPPVAQSALSPAQLLLLTTLATDNLSLNAAAESLCISVSAANKHVAGIKRNLGAKTIASAVYKAVQQGLIDC